jgi:hypothetical protein
VDKKNDYLRFALLGVAALGSAYLFYKVKRVRQIVAPIASLLLPFAIDRGLSLLPDEEEEGIVVTTERSEMTLGGQRVH